MAVVKADPQLPEGVCPKCRGMAFVHKITSRPGWWTCEWCFSDWEEVPKLPAPPPEEGR